MQGSIFKVSCIFVFSLTQWNNCHLLHSHKWQLILGDCACFQLYPDSSCSLREHASVMGVIVPTEIMNSKLNVNMARPTRCNLKRGDFADHLPCFYASDNVPLLCQRRSWRIAGKSPTYSCKNILPSLKKITYHQGGCLFKENSCEINNAEKKCI